jgi:hypothetical protein
MTWLPQWGFGRDAEDPPDQLPTLCEDMANSTCIVDFCTNLVGVERGTKRGFVMGSAENAPWDKLLGGGWSSISAVYHHRDEDQHVCWYPPCLDISCRMWAIATGSEVQRKKSTIADSGPESMWWCWPTCGGMLRRRGVYYTLCRRLESEAYRCRKNREFNSTAPSGPAASTESCPRCSRSGPGSPPC